MREGTVHRGGRRGKEPAAPAAAGAAPNGAGAPSASSAAPGAAAEASAGAPDPAAPSLDPAGLLAATSLFGGLPAADIAALAARCRRRDVAAGDACLREGEPGDALYVLVAGRLRVDVGDTALHEIRPGEVFGEIALVTGRARTTTVHAVRDSELLMLPADAFDELAERRPALLREVARVLVDRLLAVDRPAGRPETSLAIAVVPLVPDPAILDETLQGLAAAFSAYGATTVGRPEDVPAGTSQAEWAHRLAAEHRCVIYPADPEDREWYVGCVRQADRVLLVADGSTVPRARDRAVGDDLASLAPYTPVELLLAHRPATTVPHGTAVWARAVLRSKAHQRCHHVRRRRRADYERVARLLSGRGCGLVLGGGGARGLAHLGVMRALDEGGVPVDAVGGTSIGALMGAFRALDLDDAGRRREAIGGLVGSGFLFSPTLPLLAFSSGRKIRRLLENGLGGQLGTMDVLDCWLPFFCVSASITRAESVVHDEGHLATAVRASLSLPGLLPPVRYGDDLLLDGGLLNNLPVDIMRQRLAGGTVVAVDLGVEVEMRAPEGYEETPTGWQLLALRLRRLGTGESPPGLVSIVLRSRELAAIHAERRQTAIHRADLHLRPPLAGAPSLDFRAAQALVDVGYRYTAAQLREAGWTGRRW